MICLLLYLHSPMLPLFHPQLYNCKYAIIFTSNVKSCLFSLHSFRSSSHLLAFIRFLSNFIKSLTNSEIYIQVIMNKPKRHVI